MTSRGVVALVVFAALVGSASAHPLPGSTATVVLRDGLVRVEAHLDVDAWMRAQPARDLTEMVAGAKAQAAALVVQLDGEAVPMTVQVFPTVEQVHQVLQRPAAAHAHSHQGYGEQGHGAHAQPKVVRVQWQAARARPGAASVSVRFPEAVGPVLVSFVEPRSQRTTAGGAARFQRRGGPAPPVGREVQR